MDIFINFGLLVGEINLFIILLFWLSNVLDVVIFVNIWFICCGWSFLEIWDIIFDWFGFLVLSFIDIVLFIFFEYFFIFLIVIFIVL